ncbi:MAG: formylglycine-generating enzyme family protein [Bacteroidota bacterium]
MPSMLQLHPTLSLSTLEENMVPIKGGIMEIQGVNIQLDDFELCRYPVSQQLWYDVMGAYPERIKFQNPHRPVEGVSWNDIQIKFLPVLRDKTREGIWCLPTEAQWEYAFRGGRLESKSFSFGSSNEFNEVGWSRDTSFEETQIPGCKRPNILGLYDMAGNGCEWCFDKYDGDYFSSLRKMDCKNKVTNPSGPNDGEYNVVRGGSWNGNPYEARFYERDYFHYRNPSNHLVFRICR